MLLARFACICFNFASAVQQHALTVPPLVSEHNVKAAIDSNAKILRQTGESFLSSGDRNKTREKIPIDEAPELSSTFSQHRVPNDVPPEVLSQVSIDASSALSSTIFEQQVRSRDPPELLSDRKSLDGSIVPTNSTSRQAPKIIWSFWGRFRTICFNNAPCRTPSFGPDEPLPAIVKLSIDSWKKLNPEYDVRVLDDATMWNYLDRAELPRAFECLDVVHVSDVVRLALLVKYGGVWLDASMVTLKPLTQILNDVSHPATYVQWSSRRYVENYLLADSPGGMLLPEVKDCVWNFYESAGYATPRFSWQPWCLALWSIFERNLGAAGQYFSAEQLSVLEGYGLTGYFETHACFFKVLDERRDIRRWFNSSAVKKVDPWQVYTLQFIKGWTPSSYRAPLLDEDDDDLATQLLNTALVLKFSGSRHEDLAGFDKSLKDLRCTESTLKTVLSKSGLIAPKDCTQAQEF